MTARPLYKADVEARLAERVGRLERRLADEQAARKAAERTATGLQRLLLAERAARITADRNATQFHALLLQERIRRLPERRAS